MGTTHNAQCTQTVHTGSHSHKPCTHTHTQTMHTHTNYAHTHTHKLCTNYAHTTYAHTHNICTHTHKIFFQREGKRNLLKLNGTLTCNSEAGAKRTTTRNYTESRGILHTSNTEVEGVTRAPASQHGRQRTQGRIHDVPRPLKSGNLCGDRHGC